MSDRRTSFLVVVILGLALANVAWAGDGVVALQTADPSCPDDSGDRFVDCGNGTVTDNDTGLVWLADANCFGLLDWQQAMTTVAGLADLECDPEPGDCDCGLSDGSSPGEWRLASRDEWKAMVAAAAEMDCLPTITTDLGTECWYEGCEDVCISPCVCTIHGVVSSFYWSSTTYVPNPAVDAWAVNLDGGTVFNVGIYGGNKSSSLHAWPVRGGQ